jgi:hypothetical protein
MRQEEIGRFYTFTMEACEEIPEVLIYLALLIFVFLVEVIVKLIRKGVYFK